MSNTMARDNKPHNTNQNFQEQECGSCAGSKDIRQESQGGQIGTRRECSGRKRKRKHLHLQDPFTPTTCNNVEEILQAGVTCKHPTTG